jgi:hypothetical protein
MALCKSQHALVLRVTIHVFWTETSCLEQGFFYQSYQRPMLTRWNKRIVRPEDCDLRIEI